MGIKNPDCERCKYHEEGRLICIKRTLDWDGKEGCNCFEERPDEDQSGETGAY